MHTIRFELVGKVKDMYCLSYLGLCTKHVLEMLLKIYNKNAVVGPDIHT